MKLRNNETKKFDIQKIYIDKSDYGGFSVSFIINGQYIEMWKKNVYIDSIFDEIIKYLKILNEDDEYIKKY